MNIEIGASGVAIIWVAAIPVPSLKVDAAGAGISPITAHRKMWRIPLRC